MYEMVAEHLRDTGIYEIVSQKDANYAVGTQKLSADEYWWLKNDSALIKKFGKALHADYVMIITRYPTSYATWPAPAYKYDIKFTNIETGMLYSVSDYLFQRYDGHLNTEFLTKKMLPSMSRKLFYEAKGDLLATAMRKRGLTPAEEIKKPAASKTDLVIAPPSPPRTLAKISPPADLSSAAKRNEFEKKLEDELQNKTSVKDKTKLVVYDFNTIEQLQVVSLILSDALREELFKLGIFSLVNREDFQKVQHELDLQKSGLVDESQAVKLDKWLAANEVVTGRLVLLGNSFILQAKRTDITTMNTLGFSSLQCIAGHEEELLAGLPELARKIAGLEK